MVLVLVNDNNYGVNLMPHVYAKEKSIAKEK